MSDVSQHTFNKNVDLILKECLAISDQRGGEYEDTWALENQKTVFLDHVLRTPFDPERTMEWKRILVMAALCDVKMSRLLGAFKLDTFIDGINYQAALAGLLSEYHQGGLVRVPSDSKS